MFKRLLAFAKHRMVRGVASYAIIWPSSSLIHQTLVEKRGVGNYDWKRCYRYSLFGGLVIAPMMYFWVRTASVMWPTKNLQTAICKSLVEQILIDPMGLVLFLYIMSRMEGNRHSKATTEVETKFWKIYRIGFVFWFVAQTLNFRFVRVRNQVVVTSLYSLLWTTYLASEKSHNR